MNRQPFSNKLYDEFMKRLQSEISNKELMFKLDELYPNKDIIYQTLINIIKSTAQLEKFQPYSGRAFQILKKWFKFISFENFTKIQLSDCSFKGITFINCNFKFSKMKNVKLKNCWFINCNLDFVEWVDIINFEQTAYQITNHPNSVDFLQISPDKTLLFSGSNNGEFCFWDLKSQNILNHFNLNTSKCKQIAFLTNTKIIIEIDNQEFQLRDIRTGKQIKKIDHCIQNFKALKFSSRGFIVFQIRENIYFYSFISGKIIKKVNLDYNFGQQKLAFEENNFYLSFEQSKKELIILDVKKLNQLIKLYSEDGFHDFTFSPDGSYFIELSFTQQSIQIWNIKNKTLQNQIIVPYIINSMIFSRDKSILACTDKFRNVYIYDFLKGNLLIKINDIQDAFVFYPGSLCLITNINNKIVIVDPLNQSKYKNLMLEQESQILSQLIFSSNGEKLLILFGNQSYLYEIQSGQKFRKKNILNNIYITFHPSFKISAFYENDNPQIIQYYDFDKEIVYNKMQNKFKATSLDISRDEQYLACGCKDSLVRIFNVKTNQLIQTLKGHKQEVQLVQFSQNGKILATGALDRTIILWNLEDGQSIAIYPQFFNTQFVVAISPKNEILAHGQNQNIVLWDFKNKNDKNFLIGIGLLNKLIYLTDGLILATHKNQKHYVWNVKVKQIIWKLELNCDSQASYSPKTKMFVILENQQIFMQLYQIYFQTEFKTLLKNLLPVKHIKYSQLYQFLFINLMDGNLFLYDFKSEKLSKQINDQQTFINLIALSSSDLLLAQCQATIIKLLQIKTQQHFKKLVGHKDIINFIEFSKNEKNLLSGSQDGSIILWDIQSEIQIKFIQNCQQPVNQVFFLEDNCKIISNHFDNKIYFWSIEEQIQIGFYEHPVEIFNLAVSPQSRLVALSSQDCKIYLLDIISRQIIQQYDYHRCKINSIIFSQDQNFLLSCSDDETVCIQSLEYDQLIEKSYCTEGKVKSVAFLNDNYSFCFGNENGEICQVSLISENIRPLRFLEKDSSQLFSQNSSLSYAKITTVNGFNLGKMFPVNIKN